LHRENYFSFALLFCVILTIILSIIRFKTGSDNSDSEEDTKIVAEKSQLKFKDIDTSLSSVIYIGRIPDGFEELEIRKLLKQFGAILAVKLCRTRKTGRSKGFAFVKFDEKEEGLSVANIVAEYLSGYILSNKRLVCHVMRRDQVSPYLFLRRQASLYPHKARNRRTRLIQESQKIYAEPDRVKKMTAKLAAKRLSKSKKLNKFAIDYTPPTVSLGLSSDTQTISSTVKNTDSSIEKKKKESRKKRNSVADDITPKEEKDIKPVKKARKKRTIKRK